MTNLYDNFVNGGATIGMGLPYGQLTGGSLTSNTVRYGSLWQQQQTQEWQQSQAWQNIVQSFSQHPPMALNNNRILIVANGQVTEMPEDATLKAATEKAEQLAHQFQCEAYILKPVRKVAPKRDVITTDL